MNMTVINKNNNEKYEVYHISYDNAGYPHFLIYKDNQWIRMSAKHFKPYTLRDAFKEVNEKMPSIHELGRWGDK